MNASYNMKSHTKNSEKVFLIKDLNKTSSQEENSSNFKVKNISNKEKTYEQFMKHHTCYDLIPLSAKLVVFDISLNVTKAFYALVYNGVRVAILWDSVKQSYVGMLTITDFIMILDHFYQNQDNKMKRLEEHKIRTWRDELMVETKALVYITPEKTLLDAVHLLLTHKVHRLPVIDATSGNTLHILTHKRLLKYLHLHMSQLPSPEFMNKTLLDLPELGTRQNIALVHTSTPIHTALKLFLKKRVSALPVLDDTNRIVDIYAKFDVINLAATRTYDRLDISVYDALSYRRPHFNGVATCRLDNTLREIIDQIVDAGVHRLVVVNEDMNVLGIVSLSDILRYLISQV